MATEGNHPITACHVLAVPYPGRGHINHMLNVCCAVAEKSSDIFVTFVLTEEWLGLIGSASKPPNLCFATIPNVLPSELVRGEDPRGFFLAVLLKMEETVGKLLDQLSFPPAIIIADTFLPWAADMAARRDIPLASLWPMSASVFAACYHFDLLVQNGHFPINLSVNGDDIVDYIPGLPPVHLRDLPIDMRVQENETLIRKMVPKAKVLIFTTIYELETQIIDAFKEKSTYSIYNIGPAASYFRSKHMSSNSISSHDQENTDHYLTWLDLQPPKSVLYVSLGSFLSVSTAQTDEMAAGLHESGVRFLWVVHGETSRLQKVCGDKGFIVAWCDQLRVLCHPSVGGFWSHCGWNSTLEAILAGVPLLTFPIIVDQVPNAKMIVDDWKVGWRVKREFNGEDLARRDEIAELVQGFMNLESPERKELSRNARKLQKICEREFASGQSYQTNLDGFVKSIVQFSPAAL